MEDSQTSRSDPGASTASKPRFMESWKFHEANPSPGMLVPI